MNGRHVEHFLINEIDIVLMLYDLSECVRKNENEIYSTSYQGWKTLCFYRQNVRFLGF